MKLYVAVLLGVFAGTFAGGIAEAVQFEGERRACAGAVPDSVHIIEVAFRVDNLRPVQFQILGADEVYFARGTRIKSRGRSVPWTCWPQADGRINLRIRGACHPCSPTLVARQFGRELGRIRLEFGAPYLYRRFSETGINFYEPDTGLHFTSDGSHGKLYLKFRKSRALGDVNGNWEPVAGHRLRVYVSSVDARINLGRMVTKPSEIAAYGRVFNPGQPQDKECIVTTRADGSAQFEFSGTGKDTDAQIYIGADDLTVPVHEATLEPGQPRPQTVPEYRLKTGLPLWFPTPKDIAGRLLWRDGAGPADRSHWRWCDLSHGHRSVAKRLNLVARNESELLWGAFQARLAPDASRAIFYRDREQGVLDNCHDTLLADLTSGKVSPWREYLFGESEVWSRDGKRIGFVAGSLDTVLSGVADAPLRLSVRPAIGRTRNEAGVEQLLRTDNGLDRDSLNWTKSGDLLAGVSWAKPSKTHPPGINPESTPGIMRFKGGTGKGTVWQYRAGKPVPSADGRHIAFFGPERSPDGNWRDSTPALCVADDDGSNRRTLTRVPSGSKAFFEPDGRHILLFSFQSDDQLNGIVSSPAYDAQKPDLSPVRMFVALTEFDISNGRRRPIAELNAVYRPWTPQNPPGPDDVSPIGPDGSGKYFFFSRREMEHDKDGWGRTLANALHAIRLSDGKLIPIAVLPDEVAFAAR